MKKRTELLLYAAPAFVCSVFGFVLLRAYGWYVVGVCAVYTALYGMLTVRRYRAIERLSHSVTKILHGQEKLLIAESKEGELAILYSEIQKMTVRLKESADRLQEDKLFLTDAIADISHQLRTPLTAMNLTLSLLSEEDISEERRVHLLRELKKSMQHIDWLVETLLKISRIDAGAVTFAKESVSVRRVVEKAAAQLQIPMELRGQTLELQVAEEHFTGDFSWSVQAVGNILKNSMEHTPFGGKITVTAQETPLFVQITVCDTGPGFAKEDLPHLFERFYRGQSAEEGSVGIGLSLARQIICAQNGSIQATNARSGGAQFTVRFYKGTL